jgi:hypothetical protein
VDLALAEARGAAGLAQQLEHVARVARAERGRRAQHHRAKDVGHAGEQRVEARHRVGILARDARERRMGG